MSYIEEFTTFDHIDKGIGCKSNIKKSKRRPKLVVLQDDQEENSQRDLPLHCGAAGAQALLSGSGRSGTDAQTTSGRC